MFISGSVEDSREEEEGEKGISKINLRWGCAATGGDI